jgi:hypothetical protein
MSRTVVFLDGVPPATPALINPYALNPHTLQATIAMNKNPSNTS